MSIIAITTQLSETDFILPNSTVYNPQEIQRCFTKLSRADNDNLEITIYDRTQSDGLKNNEIIPIKDHINKTGHNPLIGNQQKLKIDFIDLTNIYSTTRSGVITECFGSNPIGSTAKYPSAYLCNISILARALGFLRIKAFLVNKI